MDLSLLISAICIVVFKLTEGVKRNSAWALIDVACNPFVSCVTPNLVIFYNIHMYLRLYSKSNSKTE